MSAFITYAIVSTLAGGLGKVMGNKKRPPQEVEDLNKKVMEPESPTLENIQDDIQLTTEEEKKSDIRRSFDSVIATQRASLSKVEETSLPAIQSDISVLESLKSGLEVVQESQSETQKVIKATSSKQLQGLSDIWKSLKSISAGVVGYGTAQAQSTIERSGVGPLAGIGGTALTLATQLWSLIKNFMSGFGKGSFTDHAISSGVNPYEKLKFYTSPEAKKIMSKSELTPEEIYQANFEEYKYRKKNTEVYDGLKVTNLAPSYEKNTYSLDSISDMYDKKSVAKKFIESNWSFFNRDENGNEIKFEEIAKLFDAGEFDKIIARIPDLNEMKEVKLSDIGFKVEESKLKKNTVVEDVREDILKEVTNPVGKVEIEKQSDILDNANSLLNSLNLETVSESEMLKYPGWNNKKALANILVDRLKGAEINYNKNSKVTDIMEMIDSGDFTNLIIKKEPEVEKVGESSNSQPPPIVYQDNSQHNTTPIVNVYGYKQSYGQNILTPESQTILSS